MKWAFGPPARIGLEGVADLVKVIFILYVVVVVSCGFQTYCIALHVQSASASDAE